MSTSSLYPRLLNLLRFGTIEALDLVKAHCRVRTGALLTDWVAWCTPFAGAVCTWQAPTLGEQALLLCPEGKLSAGVALRGLYTHAYPAPSSDPALHTVIYPDGACLSYHWGTVRSGLDYYNSPPIDDHCAVRPPSHSTVYLASPQCAASQETAKKANIQTT